MAWDAENSKKTSENVFLVHVYIGLQQLIDNNQ